MVLLMMSTFGMRAAMFCGLTTRLDRPGSGAGSPLSGFSGSLPLLSLSTSSIGSSWFHQQRGPYRGAEPAPAPRLIRRLAPLWAEWRIPGASLSVSKTCVPLDSGTERGGPGRRRLTGLAFRKVVEEAVLGRPDGGLRPRAEIQLAENVRNMMLDRLVRQEQVGGDLLVRLAVGRQAQNPFFLVRERGAGHLVGAGGHLPDPFQDLARHLRIEQRAALRDGDHGIDQAGFVDLLQEISRGAGHDGFVHGIFVGVGRQHDDFAAEIATQDLATSVDATSAGHADIEQDDIGT